MATSQVENTYLLTGILTCIFHQGHHSHHGDHLQLPQGHQRQQGNLWTNHNLYILSFQTRFLQFSVSHPNKVKLFFHLKVDSTLTPLRSSCNYRSPSPVRQNTNYSSNPNHNQGISSDRNQNRTQKPTSPPPPHRPPLPSPWRLEAAAYPPPGLRAGRRREGGGEGEERLKGRENFGEEESWRREEIGDREDYRSLYQRERQEKEVS